MIVHLKRNEKEGRPNVFRSQIKWCRPIKSKHVFCKRSSLSIILVSSACWLTVGSAIGQSESLSNCPDVWLNDYWLTDCIDWLMHWLTDALIDWCIDWLRFTDRLTCWTADSLFNYLIVWMNEIMLDRSIDWLVDWLIVRLSDRLNEWAADSLSNYLIDLLTW